ncbi:flagellin, partial [Bacillus cereus]
AKDTASLNKEYEQLKGEIDHIAGKTNFNGNAFLDKADPTNPGKDITIQLSDAANDTLVIEAIDTKALTSATLLTLADVAGATTEMGKIDTAIQAVADARATFGSQLNR